MNYKRYSEICEEYKVYRGRPENIEDYDVVVESVGVGYAHTKYRVLKNAPGLSTRDLAIICDEGNLCFGYRTEGGLICVHTD